MKSLYKPENNLALGIKEFDDVVKRYDWRMDPETFQLVPYVAEEKHLQDVVDSFIGQDVLSQIRKLDAASFGEAVDMAVSQGIFTPAPEQKDDVNLDLLPKSRAEALRLQAKAKDEARQVNEALGLDFSVQEYAQGLADQAIKDYIQSRIGQLTPKGEADNG